MCCWRNVPGTGKTTLAKALALSCRADFQKGYSSPPICCIVGIVRATRERGRTNAKSNASWIVNDTAILRHLEA